MTTGDESKTKAEALRPSSSIAGEVWHGATGTPAYEWWYFDAISDNGRDALVIIFLTNFVFSPRYNRAAAEQLQQSTPAASQSQFPAVAVCFYHDGRPLFRAINEYAPADFQASATKPECHIGENSFRFIKSNSAPRYELNINTPLRGNRILQARLVMSIQDGDFFTETGEDVAASGAHHWNMVAPRCRISGGVAVIKRNGTYSFQNVFHGAGYHDHNRDTRWMPATIDEWQWGRFHFPSATAVFYRYRERGDENQTVTRLYLIQDKTLLDYAPHITSGKLRRHLFGLRYPKLLTLSTNTATQYISLNVRQRRVMDGSFFYLRFLSEGTLEIAGNPVERAVGITEQLTPRSLSFSWLHWLINMRIGSDGRGAFLP